MTLENKILSVDQELKVEVEKAKAKAKAKKKRLQEKARKKCFSNAKLLERELKKRGVNIEKPFYDFSSEDIIELAKKLAPKLVEDFVEEPEDFELDYDN